MSEMTVNRDQSTTETPDGGANEAPLYVRIQRHILDQIEGGELSVGDRLPTEMEFARQFETSRATVQLAMSRLVHEGWIEKQAGRGTFVASAGHSMTIDLREVRSFEEEVAAQGERVAYRLVNVGRVEASEEVAERLGIEEGETVFRLERLRLVGDQIIGMERRFFAPGIKLSMPVEALDEVSTHDLVQRFLDRRIGRMEASIRAAAATSEIAAMLDVPAGSPLLLRRHKMYSKEGETILIGEAYYCEPFAFRYVARSDPDA